MRRILAKSERRSGDVRFTEDFVEQVRAGNDIVQVIGEAVALQKKGKTYWACCPFHHEKTPSFSVSPEKNFFYCFGCHEAGDVFSFIQKYEHCTFPEAVERLANRIHLEVPQADLSPAERKREKWRQALYEVNERAADYFHNCLTKTALGAPGLAYWQRRGLSAQTVVDFKLGYAVDEWSRLYRDFTKRGYSKELLLAAGLCTEKNGEVYDRFRGRCMFPIRDTKGRVVGFGGRILDAGEPKYLNSPETAIFNKRNLLFALSRALPAIRKTEQAVLVEGYMDVVGVHNQGVTNVVASLGTAFTEAQARLLHRSAKELLIAYDMDGAGRAATKRAIEIARKVGIRLRIVTLPDGKDPDEYIRTHGAEAWQEAVRAAQGVIDYSLKMALRQGNPTTIEGKNKILSEMLPLIVETENAVAIDGYLTKLAGALRMNEGLVRSEAQKYIEQTKKDVYVAPASSSAQESTSATGVTQRRKAEERLIGYLLQGGDVAAVAEQVPPSDFTDPLWQAVYAQCLAVRDETGALAEERIRAAVPEEERERYARAVMAELPAGGTATAYMRPLRRAALQDIYEQHCRQAEEYIRQGDEARYREEMKAGMKANEQLREWQ